MGERGSVNLSGSRREVLDGSGASHYNPKPQDFKCIECSPHVPSLGKGTGGDITPRGMSLMVCLGGAMKWTHIAQTPRKP